MSLSCVSLAPEEPKALQNNHCAHLTHSLTHSLITVWVCLTEELRQGSAKLQSCLFVPPSMHNKENIIAYVLCAPATLRLCLCIWNLVCVIHSQTYQPSRIAQETHAFLVCLTLARIQVLVSRIIAKTRWPHARRRGWMRSHWFMNMTQGLSCVALRPEVHLKWFGRRRNAGIEIDARTCVSLRCDRKCIQNDLDGKNSTNPALRCHPNHFICTSGRTVMQRKPLRYNC